MFIGIAYLYVKLKSFYIPFSFPFLDNPMLSCTPVHGSSKKKKYPIIDWSGISFQIQMYIYLAKANTLDTFSRMG